MFGRGGVLMSQSINRAQCKAFSFPYMGKRESGADGADGSSLATACPKS